MPKHYRKIDSSELHHLPAGTVHPADTYFHFSFANYHNPDRMRFGVLRVLNDDDIKPYDGFDKHPHRDMEIVSYVVNGQLTHWDSVTNTEDRLQRGHAQVITAGQGIWHSELNKRNDWTRLLQIWILPPEPGLPVRYAQHKFAPEDRLNTLLQIVGNPSNGNEPPLSLNQDVNIYVSELTDTATRVPVTIEPRRQAYLYNFEGSLVIEGLTTLEERDALEIVGPAELSLSPRGEHAHFIVIEMPEISPTTH